MKTLFLAWQAPHASPQGGAGSRAWYPIGRLDSLPNEKLYRFTYTQGAQRAHREAGFGALDGFPALARVYEDNELFPLFQNRLVSPRRRDYAEFVQRLALDPNGADPMDVLAVSEGRRVTDHLEVFAPIKARRDDSFSCRFFVHGWRHANPAAQTRLQCLAEGESLGVAVELTNPVTVSAVQIQSTRDYFVLGWAPRYLVPDLQAAATAAPEAIEARVLRLNPEPAPHNQRVLVELTGRFAPGYQPMSGLDFQPLTALEAAMH